LVRCRRCSPARADEWQVGAFVCRKVYLRSQRGPRLTPFPLMYSRSPRCEYPTTLTFLQPCRFDAQHVPTSHTTKPGNCKDTYGSRTDASSSSILAYRALGSNARAAITLRHEKRISGGTVDEFMLTSSPRLLQTQKQQDSLH
jgi:hypothetical protein